MYTGEITFANLSSQDVTPSEKSPQDPEGFSTPPPVAVVVEPCSPKSVYSLANKVRLAPLRGDAVTDSPIS